VVSVVGLLDVRGLFFFFFFFLFAEGALVHFICIISSGVLQEW
jgi:hypothetical protein